MRRVRSARPLLSRRKLHRSDRSLLVATKFDELLRDHAIAVRQHRDREQGCIDRARFTDGEGRYRHAARHLHNGQQRIESLQMAAGHRDTEHGEGGLGRNHSGQMRRAACTRDDAPEPAARRILRIAEHYLWRAMRGDDFAFVRNAELLQVARSMLHDIPIAVAAHYHANQRFAHSSAYSVETIFSPTMPATMSPMKSRRKTSRDSLNRTMPRMAVPTAPMPVQTA